MEANYRYAGCDPVNRIDPLGTRGLPKTHLQHMLAALALNLVRLGAWLTGTPLGGNWASRLTRLRPALSPM
jgi:hypothetical protein